MHYSHNLQIVLNNSTSKINIILKGVFTHNNEELCFCGFEIQIQWEDNQTHLLVSKRSIYTRNPTQARGRNLLSIGTLNAFTSQDETVRH